MDQYPRGKLNADDEGELALRVGVRDKVVIIDFGKPVAWLGLDKEHALAFAALITKRAEEI